MITPVNFYFDHNYGLIIGLIFDDGKLYSYGTIWLSLILTKGAAGRIVKMKNSIPDPTWLICQPSMKRFVERSRYAAEKSKMVYTPRICPISGIYKKGVYIMIPTEVNRF
ncbi:MAG: hypothetical protein WA081_09040, partial [Desulfosalsimonadaceae bacterium]